MPHTVQLILAPKNKFPRSIKPVKTYKNPQDHTLALNTYTSHVSSSPTTLPVQFHIHLLQRQVSITKSFLLPSQESLQGTAGVCILAKNPCLTIPIPSKPLAFLVGVLVGAGGLCVIQKSPVGKGRSC